MIRRPRHSSARKMRATRWKKYRLLRKSARTIANPCEIIPLSANEGTARGMSPADQSTRPVWVKLRNSKIDRWSSLEVVNRSSSEARWCLAVIIYGDLGDYLLLG
jgi:hypothetical protein